MEKISRTSKIFNFSARTLFPPGKTSLAWKGKHEARFGNWIVFGRSPASLQQKFQLFKASSLTVLLYGCEYWVLTSDLCRQLDSFQPSCVRIILGISRTYHVSNEEVYDRTGTVPLSQSVEARQTRFLGQFSSAPLGGPYFSKYGLHHPTHGKPRPGGCKILFHEYAAKLINPENPSLLHEICTLAAQLGPRQRQVECPPHIDVRYERAGPLQ